MTARRKTSGVLSAIILLWGITGCEPDNVDMRLLVYDRSSDAYTLNVVSVETLYDVDRLAGESTVIKGGLSIVIDYQKDSLEWKKKGKSVAFSAVKNGGALVPDSFDSLAMASVYYNMELSYLFFKNSLRLDDKMPSRLPTYYWPNIEIVQTDGQRLFERDNAFYMKISDAERGFFVMPFDEFQWIPMALNSGIITHEYTHYIFDVLVNDKADGLDEVSDNFLYSVNEANSDFMAVVRTGDPRYMSHTIPSGLYVTPNCNSSAEMELSRDIANPEFRNYSGGMDSVARNTASDAYCPYEIGLVVAAMLYEIAGRIDGLKPGQSPSDTTLLRVAKWWITALELLGEEFQTQKTFELWDLFSLFIVEFDSLEKKNPHAK